MSRYLPDPPSRTGGILTKRELDAALRVLAALRRPSAASVVLGWDNDMQDALGGLKRVGYVEQRGGYDRAPSKSTAPYREDKLATTELGLEYLGSIQKGQGQKHHATRTSPMTEKDIAFETDRYWVKRVPKGFEVYKTGLTHSVRVAQISYAGTKGLQRAKREIERREAADGPSRAHSRKKSPAQLSHEIEQALAMGRKKAPRRHATKKTAPRPAPYRIKLAPSELKALEFARGRYSWPDMLSAHAAEDGSVAFTESEMWQWTDDVDSDDSPFPLAAPALAAKLQRFYDEKV